MIFAMLLFGVFFVALFGWRLGLAMSSAVALIFLFWRLTMWDNPLTATEDKTYQDVQPIAVPREVLKNGEPLVLERAAKTVQAGDLVYTFSGRELDRLLAAFEDGQTRLTREMGAWTGPTYPKVRAVLQGRGLVDDGLNWTPAGIAWLRQ